MIREWAAWALYVLCAVFGIAACFSFGGDSLYLRSILAIAVGLFLLLLSYIISRQRLRIVDVSNWYLLLALLLGLIFRLGVAALVRPVEVSDMASYHFTAVHLLNAHEYVCKEGPYLLHAYRPPGVPFLLAGLMAVTGQHPWSPLLLNCLLFIGTAVLLWFGTHNWVVVAMLAIWPSDIAVAPLTQSETPTVLVSAALIFVLLRVRGLWASAVSLGLITGVSCLIRNSNLVMLGVWIIVLLCRRGRLLPRLGACVVTVLCAILPIVPWTIRNYGIFHQPVLVATNGGENLWSANNPYTDGSFDEESLKITRSRLPDEIAMDRLGYQLGKEWIRSHPANFLLLSFNKVRLLLGSDAWGWYYALERGTGYSGPVYRALSLIADLWWILIWVCVLALLWRWPQVFHQNAQLFAIGAFTLVPALLFFVFQSQPRYHAFMLPGLLCIATARSLTRIAASPR